MAGGRHMAGRARRVVLRDFVYRPRKARIELASFAAHIRLPSYFGSYEWSVPIRSIAAVDLTVPGTPRDLGDLQGQFIGRTITYLFTTARARSATTLLLFAQPQRVPPLRLGPGFDLGVRPFLPFGYVSTRRRRGAWIDGLLLRADDPRGAVDQLVAAGALRGVYRDGAWRVHRGERIVQPAADPPWARRSVDRFDGAARALMLAGALGGLNVPNVAEFLGRDVGYLGWSRYLDHDIPLWPWVAVAGAFAAGFVCRLIATLLYRRRPADVPPPGRVAPPGSGPGSVRPPPTAPQPPAPPGRSPPPGYGPDGPTGPQPPGPPPGYDPRGPSAPRPPVRGPWDPRAPGPPPGSDPRGPYAPRPPGRGPYDPGPYGPRPPARPRGRGPYDPAARRSAGDRPTLPVGPGPPGRGDGRPGPVGPGPRASGDGRAGPAGWDPPGRGDGRPGPVGSGPPGRGDGRAGPLGPSPPGHSPAAAAHPDPRVRTRWALPPAGEPTARADAPDTADADDPDMPPVPPDAMANGPAIGTVVIGRRPATRPDPWGADRGRR